MADSGSGEGKVRRTGRSGGSGSCSPGVLLERRINKKKKEKRKVIGHTAIKNDKFC